jgi:DNA invertase Pin-like site-specific DNA recombinase
MRLTPINLKIYLQEFLPYKYILRFDGVNVSEIYKVANFIEIEWYYIKKKLKIKYAPQKQKQ